MENEKVGIEWDTQKEERGKMRLEEANVSEERLKKEENN